METYPKKKWGDKTLLKSLKKRKL